MIKNKQIQLQLKYKNTNITLGNITDQKKEKTYKDIPCMLHNLQSRHQELLAVHDKVQQTKNDKEKKVWEEKYEELEEKHEEK